uniref:Defender against cell death 1 n=1 Tax=Parastrongyloides trichosuri TaxID=131310 RepID=A0A0N4ZCF6_PARTI
MCIILVLLLNTFYKMYYRLFDLCEHVAAMITFLIFLGLMVGTIILSTNSSNQPRPLLTIAILVFGVLGGLAVVITVVYFYKLCLKRRAPITTTGKPDQKRAQIRSLVNTQCRPLTISHPQYIQIAGQQYKAIPSTQHVVPDLVLSEVITDHPQSYQDMPNPRLEYALANSTRNLPKISHSSERKKLNRNGENLQLNNCPVYEPSSKNDKTGNFLSPDNNITSNGRTKSAEMLLNVEVNDEIRRASTGSMYHPVNGIAGQRRRLPSTAHLSPLSNIHQYYNSGLVNEHGQRRSFALSRSQAIDNRDQPLKQSSSPLPSQRDRIYSRQHAFSKSWNIEDQCYRNEYILPSIRKNKPNYATNDYIMPNNYPIPSHPIMIPPLINVMPPSQSIQGTYPQPQQQFVHEIYPIEKRTVYPVYDPPQYVYQEHTLYNQPIKISPKIEPHYKDKAISFDEKTSLLKSRRDKAASYTTPKVRALSEADKKNLIRQQTIQHLQPDSVVSKQCLDIWKDRKKFETDPIYMNQLSTDLSDDNSISTSFESNSESPIKDRKKQDQNSSSVSRSSEAASLKRQKFRNIMLKRQLLDDGNTGFETSSYESSFELTGHHQNEKIKFRGWEIDNSDIYANSSLCERDYSIDSKSDSLFRLFSLNDPKYMSKTIPPRFQVLSCQKSIIPINGEKQIIHYSKQEEIPGIVIVEESSSHEECALVTSQESGSVTGDDNPQIGERQIYRQYKRVSSKEDSDVT